MYKMMLVGAFVLWIAGASFAQNSSPKSRGQIAPQDPFRIESGSFFEASSPHRAKIKAKLDAIENDFSEALDIIRQNHVSGNKLPVARVTKSAIGEMLHALDPHSSFYDEGEYRELQSEHHSEYSGIGVVIANYSVNGKTETFVTSTYPRSPAHRANLRFGDKIIRVNGADVRGLPVSKVRSLIRGEQGTTLRLLLERASDLKTETVVLKRELVAQPSISDAYVLKNGVGYIDLSGGFSYATAQELNTALQNLQRLGARSLILDLRENPGGLLEQAVRVAEAFLPGGKIVLKQRGRGLSEERIWQSAAQTPVDLPLAVLVNGNTASASEIVAGALQDHHRAVIIGETTFGKGLVQSIFGLPNGAGLALTTARYYTPAGRSLQRDYQSTGGFYDYYARHQQKEHFAQIAKTSSGQKNSMLGGIVPDETVRQPELDRAKIKISNSLFYFARELMNGRIKNFEHYQLSNQPRFGRRIEPDEFPIEQDLTTAFYRFAETERGEKLRFKNHEKFLLVTLRELLATANYGAVTANQVSIESDSQVLRAVEVLSRAKNLARISKH